MNSDFPALSKEVNGNKLIYLDNAATSLTPQIVIDEIKKYYEDYNANIHRGMHEMSEEATVKYEKVHEKVAEFINAESEEIIFTKNTTESLNLLAYTLTKDITGDVVLSEMEHHSNLVPWQQLSQERDFDVKYIPVRDGKLDMEKAEKLIDDNTEIVSVTHVSNFLGTINPIKKLEELAHEQNAYFVLDAAQSVPHMNVDVEELNADFLAFSGHKMLGPTGIGVLYGKKELLEEMKPFLYGGDMIREVSFENTTFNNLPWKFEAGTPNIADAIALGKAIEYLQNHGLDEVEKHSRRLAEKAAKELEQMGAEVYGPEERIGVVSFNFENIHPHDLSTILNDYGIAVRGGDHCVMPLHKKMDISASCRASFYLYNNEEDIQKLKEGLLKAREVFS